MLNLSDKKIAIFGGTFNPIHIGHLLTGLDLIEKYHYDYVVYVTANIPPHKEIAGNVSSFHRLEMVKLAIKSIDKFLSSDIEIKNSGISYTIDTIREFKKKHKISKKISVIIGDDLIENIDTWKEIDKLQNESNIICLTRDVTKDLKTNYKIKKLENRIIQINSSEIRKRIKTGLSIDYMVPEKVRKYINRMDLYKGLENHERQ